MQRLFKYAFTPAALNPAPGATEIALTIDEIETAAVLEVVQTPGARLGSWLRLRDLLTHDDPAGLDTPFLFREPFGHAREVKVALSGLFGRFVARAYLSRYFNLNVFAHIGPELLWLDGKLQIRVAAVQPGDRPDWAACTSDLTSLSIAEAKGTLTQKGLAKVLQGAWEQAQRVEVHVGGRLATVKRFAVATRWGFATGGLSEALLSVHDPEHRGDASDEEQTAACLGLLRCHLANILQPLGYGDIARELRAAADRGGESSDRGWGAFKTGPAFVVGDDEPDALIGGFVTRSGTSAGRAITQDTQRELARLGLAPVFVGVERKLITAAINGDRDTISGIARRPHSGAYAAQGRGGVWVIPIESNRILRTEDD